MARNQVVMRYEDRLNHLFELTESLPNDLLIRSHWARYLCVMSAGYLETSIRAIYGEYARTRSTPYIANYVDSKLKGFYSAKMNNIVQLAGTFNPNWADDLTRETEGELADSVNSIVNNRHQIAHGKDTGVSLANLSRWHKNATKVIKLLEEMCT